MDFKFELQDIEMYPEVDQQLILYRLCNLGFLLGYLSREYDISVKDIINDIQHSEDSVREILDRTLSIEPVGTRRWQVLSKYVNYLLGGDPTLEELIPLDKRETSEAKAGKLLIKLLNTKFNKE